MKDLYKRLLEFTKCGVCQYTFDKGEILYANPGFVEMLGLGISHKELEGKLIKNVMVLVKGEKSIRKLLDEKGEIRGLEYHFRTRTGKDKWVILDAVINKSFTDAGKIVEAKACDITEIKYREMLKAQRLESIGILAGGIAHDFNNILTAILGNISLVKMESGGKKKLTDLLEEAEKASLSARKITQQFLTFAKGGVPLRKTINISHVVKDTSSISVRGGNVKCSFEVQKDLWPVTVDDGQVSQVINNLVINAEQAMPAGGKILIKIKNAVVKKDRILPLKAGKYVVISIKDNGVGISKQNLRKIFNPYFTTKENGRGLGLAVSYSVVLNHAGVITVDSKVRKGTTFCIYLPADESGKVKEAPRRKKVYPVKCRILFMDDEEIVRKIAGEMLGYIGCKADLVKNGKEAVLKYKAALKSKNPYNLAILDLTVSKGMGGKETVKELKKIDPDVKAVITSGYSYDPALVHYRKMGFLAAIKKPFSIEDLNKVLLRVLKKKGKTSSR
ncbi:MAG: response regulator [Candidatus Aureabacteria bacterium]|nr:response regulator [Candidatus Auribacterota bacterium]